MMGTDRRPCWAHSHIFGLRDDAGMLIIAFNTIYFQSYVQEIQPADSEADAPWLGQTQEAVSRSTWDFCVYKGTNCCSAN